MYDQFKNTPQSGGGRSTNASATGGNINLANFVSWRNSGFAAMVGAGLAVLGFFLPWISLNASILGDVGPSFGGDISAWSMAFKLIAFLPSIFGGSSGASQSGTNNIPAMIEILVIIGVIDIIALVVIPILGSLMVIHGYRIVENPNASYLTNVEKRLKIKKYVIACIIPTIIFLLLLQGALGFSLNGSSGSLGSYFGGSGSSSTGGSVSLGLGVMGIGFWLSLIGLLSVFVSGALLTPKE